MLHLSLLYIQMHCQTGSPNPSPTIWAQQMRSLWLMESVLARKDYVLWSLIMHPVAFDNPPCPCKLSPPAHHSATSKLVSNGMVTIREDHRWSGSASTALPQTMRIFESQWRRGFVEMNTWQVCGGSQSHSWCALEGERRTQWDNGAIMEGRNDGGCGQRTKYFAKFRSKRLLNQHVTAWPMQRASQQHIAGIATCTHVNISTSTHKW